MVRWGKKGDGNDREREEAEDGKRSKDKVVWRMSRRNIEAKK